MESIRILNGVPTRCLTFDRPPLQHSSSSHPSHVPSSPDYLILIIPGNPGVIEFYREFMSETFSLVKEKFPSKSIPVMGISHCGHEKIDMKFPDLDQHLHLYDLKGQIEAKVEFLKTLPKNVKIIAIGHSIGCKMLLETLKGLPREVEERVIKCYLLFPTIERMRETPNGRKLGPILPYYDWVYYLLLPLMMMPRVLQRFLLTLYFYFRTPPECIINAALELFHGPVNRRMAALAKAELDQVVDLDVDTLLLYEEKLFFYFGTSDKWCPLHYADGLTAKVPTIKHQICHRGIEHAFVVKSSQEMAAILSPLIAQDVQP